MLPTTAIHILCLLASTVLIDLVYNVGSANATNSGGLGDWENLYKTAIYNTSVEYNGAEKFQSLLNLFSIVSFPVGQKS